MTMSKWGLLISEGLYNMLWIKYYDLFLLKDTWDLTVYRDMQYLKAVLHSFEGLLFIFLGGAGRYPA